MNRLDEWQRDDFVPLALDWVDAALAAHSVRREAAPDWSRVRPWGTVLRIPVTGGCVWFKATPDGSAEVVLHETLYEAAAEHVPALLASDRDRGWLLLADVGPSLADESGLEAEQACAEPRFLESMRQYAVLQHLVADRIDDLVAQGLPDARPEAMPGVFDTLHEALSRRAAETHDRDATDLLRHLTGARSLVVDLAAQCSGRPGSIDHDDLHPWNVAARPGPAVVMDWGDAMAAHPYAALLVPVRIAGLHSPAAARAVLDAYAHGSGHELDRTELLAAARLAAVSRAWTWERSLAMAKEHGPHEGASLKWFARILDDDPLVADRD